MNEAKFATFMMSETTRNQIKALPQDMQLKFFWAVTDFGLDGIEPNFEGIEYAIWIPMRDLILNSKRQDEAWRNKQRENGKKGGRPRKTPVNKETQENPKNPGVIKETQKTQGFSDENPKSHNKNNNDNVNNNDNDNQNSSGFAESKPDDSSSSKKTGKPKKTPLRKREPVNDMERVEKAYLQNWDVLFAQKKVKTADPVMNWNQTRKLLKNHFQNIKPDLIIQAINNGMTDEFVLGCGYSLGTILTAAVLNRLINAGGKGPPQTLKGKKSLKGVDSW